MLSAVLAARSAATAMVAGGALPQALSVQRPIIVHVWDAKPDKLETFAIDEVSKACRNAGAAAVLCSPKMLKAFVEEQELAMGGFPEPLPIIAQVALKDMIETETAGTELVAGAKKLGAAAIGIGYYASDWPEAEALDVAQQHEVLRAAACRCTCVRARASRACARVCVRVCVRTRVCLCIPRQEGLHMWKSDERHCATTHDLCLRCLALKPPREREACVALASLVAAR